MLELLKMMGLDVKGEVNKPFEELNKRISGFSDDNCVVHGAPRHPCERDPDLHPRAGSLERHRHPGLAAKIHRLGTGEAIVAQLHRMTQIEPVDRCRQQIEKGGEFVSLERLARRQLPKDGAKPIAQR